MKSNNIKIGVLGGIGPEATAYFYTKLIENFQSTFHPLKNTGFPQIIINSIPAPELIYSGEIKDKDIVCYKKGIKDLNKHNPNFIVMICNTIYLFYKELQQISKSRILNIRECILKRINNLPQKDVYILGTPNTINGKLYYTKNKNYFNLNENDSLFISELVKKYNLGINKGLQADLFNKFLEKINTGDNIIILGCTELALMNRLNNKNIINTLNIMVEETLDLYQKQSKN